MHVLETERLILRRLRLEDAAFILELTTEPGWLRYIGDRGVHDLVSACRYLEMGPFDLYRRFGFGLYAVDYATQERTARASCDVYRRYTIKA